MMVKLITNLSYYLVIFSQGASLIKSKLPVSKVIMEQLRMQSKKNEKPLTGQ